MTTGGFQPRRGTFRKPRSSKASSTATSRRPVHELHERQRRYPRGGMPARPRSGQGSCRARPLNRARRRRAFARGSVARGVLPGGIVPLCAASLWGDGRRGRRPGRAGRSLLMGLQFPAATIPRGPASRHLCASAALDDRGTAFATDRWKLVRAGRKTAATEPAVSRARSTPTVRARKRKDLLVCSRRSRAHTSSHARSPVGSRRAESSCPPSRSPAISRDRPDPSPVR